MRNFKMWPRAAWSKVKGCGFEAHR